MKHVGFVVAALLVLVSSAALADSLDGLWTGKMTGGSCTNPVSITVADGKAKFHSPISGANAEGVIGPDGSFSMITPSMGTFGTAGIDGKFEGDKLTGTFTVKNPYHPCSSPFTAAKTS